MTAPIRVLVADDEAIVRSGLRLLIDAESDMVVTAEAADGAAAVHEARACLPDVALMDIRMPVLDGIEATGSVSALGARVVILTTFDDDDNLFAAIRAGAVGFMLKTSAPADLLHGIRVAARGDALLEPAVTRRLLERFASVHRPAADAAIASLSTRESDVLQQVARGLSNAEIGQTLFIAEGTVKTHVANILMKLGVRDRVHAVIRAYESGFVEPGECW